MFNQRWNSDYVQLREAIKKRDKVTALNLILNNANVNLPHARGASPLHWAIIKFDDLEIVTMLLNKGANMYITDHRRQKPLEVAIQNNKVQAAILLIKRGALAGQNLNSLLIMAIEKNNIPVVKNLIDVGMSYNPSIDLKSSLNAAICRGQLEIMEYLKPHCKFLNPSDHYIPRELVIKSGLNYKKCLELLLEWNFTVNPNNSQDKDFVYAAVANGYLKIVKELLKFGIDVNMMNSNTGVSLLQIACYYQYHEIVENLLKHHAHINVPSITNITAIKNFSRYYKSHTNHYSMPIYQIGLLRELTCLHFAVLNSDPVMTKLLLRYGAMIVDDPNFFNVTCIAVKNNCEEIVRIFLECGVNVTSINSEGKSLLHFCINSSNNRQDSRYSIAKLLLDHGANIHIGTPNNTLIFETIANGHQKIAELFLNYHVNIQYISSDGNTLLHKAIEKKFDVDFIKNLLKLNAPVNFKNNDMLTPLLVACKTPSSNQFEIIKALLQNNANVNCIINVLSTPKILSGFGIVGQNLYQIINFSDTNGQTPLHIVCKHKSDMIVNIIQLLLQYKANIEAEDARGWTPLFVACHAVNYLAVKCLLDNNANANRTDLQKKTPLYIAAQHCRNNSEVVKILLEHKVNVHCIDEWKNSIIHLVVQNSNAELIHSLARTQVNFNAVNCQGKTPLHIAVMRGSIDVIKNLIKYGANVNILDENRETLLENALYYKSDHQSRLEDYQERQSDYWYHQYSSENSNENGYDTDGYINDINEYKAIIRILKLHIIKLETAGLKMM
ncbi:ankyrin-3-like [Chelonus insularis]|uniref:ankyrin-3-like n=1 Tax=Chelonus insularis TaxID=460826 RepID=UPI0015895454|nr:ankyrin-3-like [Chelonus insularis]